MAKHPASMNRGSGGGNRGGGKGSPRGGGGGGVAGAPGGQPNMQALMKQAQQMQQQLLEAQTELAQTQVQGSAGNGLVTATVTGDGKVLALTVRPEVVDPEDIDTLVDLVVYALQDAQGKAEAAQAEAMGPLAGGLGAGGLGGLPGLPG